MNNIKCKNEVQIVFGILFIVGLIAILGIGTIDLTQGQTNSTANQTSTPIIAASNSNTTSSSTPSITSPSQTNSTANQTNTHIIAASNSNTTSSVLHQLLHRVKKRHLIR